MAKVQVKQKWQKFSGRKISQTIAPYCETMCSESCVRLSLTERRSSVNRVAKDTLSLVVAYLSKMKVLYLFLQDLSLDETTWNLHGSTSPWTLPSFYLKFISLVLLASVLTSLTKEFCTNRKEADGGVFWIHFQIIHFFQILFLLIVHSLLNELLNYPCR